jgi:predicted extracellular nuclease
VLDYGRINSKSTPGRDYRLHPTQAPIFTPQNVRQAAPLATGGRLTVASYNVLNYFNTIDQSGSICGPMANQGCRGADTASELARQQAKIVSALQAIDADVVGLIEIENNGFGANSAIQTLTDALNLAIGGPSAVYSALTVNQGSTPGVGGDAIAVGFIYKSANVSPVGSVATLATGAFDENLADFGRSRIPVAATFEELSSGEQFTAVINHFKSKRPPSSVQGNGNDDQGDGQASWNLRRTEASNDLADWLATNPTGVNDPDILIIGDLNSNAEEDPILALEAKGYADMVQRFQMTSGYSFTFDGLAGTLDHALASNALASQISGVLIWHANTDEPSVIDYNEDFNPAGYFNADPFRSSDHDPVVIGLNLNRAETESCYVIKAQNGKVAVFCL